MDAAATSKLTISFILYRLANSICSYLFIAISVPRTIQQKAIFKNGRFADSIWIVWLSLCWCNAEIRLSDKLPSAWEQKNIEVIGTIASMTKVQEQGEQFRFYVEQILTPDAVVPSHILLNYFEGNQWYRKAKITAANATEKPPIFKVGERWQLTIRLKGPHATYNPNGYDYEAWALTNNIRAIGVVRNKSGMQKKADFVWRPAYIVEYCRDKVAQHITRTLSRKSYAGVIRALVVGDDSKISRHDWDVYLYTGVNHLMRIFFLLKRQ